MSNIVPSEVSSLIPAKVRAIVYTIFGLVGVGVGAAQVGYLAARAEQPVWLIVAESVFAFLGTAFGYTAVTHTPKSDAAGTVVTKAEVLPNTAASPSGPVDATPPGEDSEDAPVEVDAPMPDTDDEAPPI